MTKKFFLRELQDTAAKIHQEWAKTCNSKNPFGDPKTLERLKKFKQQQASKISWNQLGLGEFSSVICEAIKHQDAMTKKKSLAVA